jgi:predicted ATPase
VIFEDLHWIDGETQALLDLVADSISNARVLLLVNYRPEYRHQWANKSYYSQLRLHALGRESASEILAALLGESVELGALKRMIIERTQGNPFFIEEMVQALFDEGALVRNGTVKMRRPLGQMRMPPTVQGILAARIDRLPTAEKDLLQTLAVVGRQAPLAVIMEIVAKPHIERMLGNLQAGEFIYEQVVSGTAVAYQFKHALTQDVAYNSLLIERRKSLHERAGQALESMFPDQLEDHLSELARHYGSSDNTKKALHYSQLAGQKAALRSADTEAINHLMTALELLHTLPDTQERTQRELALLVVLAPVLMEAKGYAAPEVERVAARTRLLSEQMVDAPELVSVLRILFGYYVNKGELHTAHELSGQMVSLADRQKDAVFLPHAHYGRGLASYFLGDFVSAREHTQRALALYEPHRASGLHSIENPRWVPWGF